MNAARPHAVPGGGSALKPPPAREPLPPEPERAPIPGDQPPADIAPPAPAPELGSGDGPPPPPAPPPQSARRQSREQLNTKIRVDLRQRVNVFVERHNSTVQGVLEAALDEYMARRGWTWEDYQRAARRRAG